MHHIPQGHASGSLEARLLRGLDTFLRELGGEMEEGWTVYIKRSGRARRGRGGEHFALPAALHLHVRTTSLKRCQHSSCFHACDNSHIDTPISIHSIPSGHCAEVVCEQPLYVSPEGHAFSTMRHVAMCHGLDVSGLAMLRPTSASQHAQHKDVDRALTVRSVQLPSAPRMAGCPDPKPGLITQAQAGPQAPATAAATATPVGMQRAPSLTLPTTMKAPLLVVGSAAPPGPASDTGAATIDTVAERCDAGNAQQGSLPPGVLSDQDEAAAAVPDPPATTAPPLELTGGQACFYNHHRSPSLSMSSYISTQSLNHGPPRRT